ncbi:unnamed protein product [Chironomus riparius]|uniref:Uncharacterized protein n=1 Tax=Chironomus riparius TaxID=315576 RepID=A0A9N9RWE0_9DIPT|nr:unnamed protein product [Chironomus riparius]
MEYTPYFRLIQTSLTHCNEFVRNFNKINYFGGNEIYINEVTLKLRNIFLGNGFTSDDCDELRKINLLLMFNTDLTHKYELKEDFQVCHLLNNFPQLSKCLYINIMWQLNLQKYFYEALTYSPSWFILPFLDETVDSLRFSKSFDVIYQVQGIVKAIYTNICRLDYRSSKSGDFNDKKLILESLLVTLTSLLRHYNTPIAEESITKSKNKTKEYNGHSLNCQLSLILSCFEMFLKKPAFEIEDKFYIYKINQDKEPEANNYSVNKYSLGVEETLTQINIILLNTLQNSVLNVTLDDFMYWVEIDMDDDIIADQELKRDNLQKLIGEQAYELVDIIKNNECFDHNVVEQLSTISLKSKTLQEIAKEASVGTVLDKIEKSPSKIVWLEELLSRTEILYFNYECLQTVIDNIEILRLEHLIQILKDHQNYDMDKEDEVQMNEIFLKGGIKLNLNDIKELIDQLAITLGTDYCLSYDPELVREQEINNYLNKITEENIEEPTMLKIILKSPQLFYEKLLEDIDSQDETQISTILKVISKTCPVSNHYIKKIIVSDTEPMEINNERSSRHLFLSGLFKLQIIDRKEFIKDIIMSNFSQALSAGANSTNLLLFLKTLKQISNQLKIKDLLPPLMIQLAQILDKFRWDLMTYSLLREEIVDTTISIIQELIKTVLINGTKNDKEWIRNKIINLKSMTKFYFQRLSLEKGEAINPFDTFLHPENLSNIPKIKITSFLCETIVRCTSKESRKLMNNEVLQNFYAEALSLLSTIVKKANQSSPLECLRKCVSDYVKILSDILIPSAKAKNQEEILLKDIVNLMKKFPTSLHDELTILFLDTIKELKIDENLLAEIDDCELKRILSDKSNVI